MFKDCKTTEEYLEFFIVRYCKFDRNLVLQYLLASNFKNLPADLLWNRDEVLSSFDSTKGSLKVLHQIFTVAIEDIFPRPALYGTIGESILSVLCSSDKEEMMNL